MVVEMVAGIHQLIEPSRACLTLGHRIDSRPKSPGPGSYDYCAVCSMGYQMAIDSELSPEAADRYVQFLRREGAS